MKFTQIPANTWEKLQMNAGIIVDDFDPATETIGNVMGATTGGFSFASNPSYVDFGDDVDNVPANTMQLKRIMSYDPVISGTFLTCTPQLAQKLIGAASIANTIKVIPASQLKQADFSDVWVIGDYSDINTGESAGFIAIHLMNALNTAGIQMRTTKDGKGQFAFEFHGHYDIEDIDTVPFEVYVRAGAGTLVELTVASTDTGVTTSGDSKITFTGYSLGAGEKFVYKTAVSTAPSVTYGESLTTGWTQILSGDTITVTSSHTKITVAAVDGNNKAVAAGDATLTIKA